MPTHYEILKVAKDAPPEVIHAAYRWLSRTHHPDHKPGDPAAAAQMAAINAAYEVLSDPLQRRDYDQFLAQAAPGAKLKPLRPVPPAQPIATTYRLAAPPRNRAAWLAWGLLALFCLAYLVIAISPVRLAAPPVPPSSQTEAPPSPGSKREPRKRRVAEVAPPFPTIAGTPPGLDRETLLARFGPPALKSKDIEEGHLVETLVYLSADREVTLMVVLRDGFVVSVKTAPY